MLLHIPHASRHIPEAFRRQFVLDDNALAEELNLVTDAFTDELFCFPGAERVVFPISRLVVDVERFPDDADEPMARAGQGMIYTHTSYGERLRWPLNDQERAYLKSEYYDKHHESLMAAVQNELISQSRALIVDCHSFPSKPLPCDEDQTLGRPDFCIGTDDCHTPAGLRRAAMYAIEQTGYSVEINKPYAGCIVPLPYYRVEPRVQSIMIEVNRRLYLDERTGIKTPGFEPLRINISQIVKMLDGFFRSKRW